MSTPSATISTPSHRSARHPVATDPTALRYLCSVCQTPAPVHAKRCSGCEAVFAGVKCGVCGYVAPSNLHAHHHCPQCGVQAAALGPEYAEAELCPACKRPLTGGKYVCGMCGWIDWPSLVWLIGLSVAFLWLWPAFAVALSWPLVAPTVKWIGLLFGGAIALLTIHTVVVGHNCPRRFTLYGGIALFGIMLLVNHVF